VVQRRVLSADHDDDGASLLASYVRALRRGFPAPAADAVWDASLPEDISDAMAHLVHHAERLSCAVQGASLVYNLLLAEARPAHLEATDGTGAETYRDWLASWREESMAVGLPEWAKHPAPFWDAVLEHGRIPPATRLFLDAWMAIVADSQGSLAASVDARDLIRTRETQHKRAQARLANGKRLAEWRGYAGTGRLLFRWPQVRRMLRDIDGGLGATLSGDAVA
jgi:hypothetical protein